MRLQIDALGARILDRELLRIGRRAVDVSPAMETILDGVRDSARLQFDSEGRHGSGGWEPLAESTVERKAQQGLDPRILHATLALRRSLTHEGGDNISIAQRDGASFGTTVDHVKYVQAKRPPIQPTEGERREWVRVVQDFIVSGDRGPNRGLLSGIV